MIWCSFGVDREEAKQIMTEILEEICGIHANGHIWLDKYLDLIITGQRWYQSVKNVKFIWIRSTQQNLHFMSCQHPDHFFCGE